MEIVKTCRETNIVVILWKIRTYRFEGIPRHQGSRYRNQYRGGTRKHQVHHSHCPHEIDHDDNVEPSRDAIGFDGPHDSKPPSDWSVEMTRHVRIEVSEPNQVFRLKNFKMNYVTNLVSRIANNDVINNNVVIMT